ncbi:MAG: hypothetical protein SXV54_21285 [Chloroflexota bacterium]|nr:hypothetical protein [Chloroflexota bacterium]
MNRFVRLCLIAGVVVVLAAQLLPWLVANVGNLYLVRGAIGNRVAIDIEPWAQAHPWLRWAAGRVNTAYTERLQRRIVRVDAFIARYTKREWFSFDVTPPVPPYIPEYLVNTTVEDWKLLGYDLNEQALELRDRVDMWLYWQRKDEEIITQQVQTENLVINGGFEQTGTVRGHVPIGFERERFTRYVPPFTHRRIVVETRRDIPTLCAQLDNRQGTVPSGYYSRDFAYEKNVCYLVGGWVLGNDSSDSEKVNIGLAFPSVPDIPVRQRNDMVTPTMSEQGWTYYAGIIQPPENTVTVRVQLNYWGTDIVCFDDILVIPLELP